MATKHSLSQSEIVEEIPLACADEMAALLFFEKQRWGSNPCCIHCGDTNVYTIIDKTTGKRRLDGRWRCRGCGKQYTVRVGQIMEDSPIPLRKWAYAFWAAASSKNGVSALELSRKLQISYKSALYMMSRIRWAMRPDKPSPKLEGTIEADETYVGGRPRIHHYKGEGAYPKRKKVPVFAVVQRGGDVRTRVMPTVKSRNVRETLREFASKSANLVTDDSNVYFRTNRDFASHESVNHSRREYVDPYNPLIHTNTIESFFARIKRSLNGTYHAVSKDHLHRYVTHSEFLYNARFLNDGERLQRLIGFAEGKRLMYKQSTKKAG